MARSSSSRVRAKSALSLSGPMTLAECGLTHQSIVAVMAKSGDLRVDLSGSGPWDLAGLQIVLAAVKTARGNGRSASLERVPDVFLDVAVRAGCMEYLSPSIVGREV